MTRKIFPAAAAPSTPHGAPPLWQQLGAVAQGLQMILAGQSGNQALAEVPARLRPGVQALLFQVLRQLGRAQALRAQLAPKAPPPKVNALLCTALALAWDAEQAPYEPFTLVNQAVEAAKRLGMERQAGFLNGCLRRFLRERDALVAATAQDIQACWNHPRWWIERLQRDHPQDWQQILQANNAHAPMSLRVNQQKTTPGAYVQLLAQQGMTASVFGDSGVQLQQAQPVQALPGFAEGHVSVQDGAAQLAADLLLRGLDCTQPLQLLDACAAPGGKTAHLLEYAGAQSAVQVVALEVDAERSLRIHDTLQRVGVAARAKVMVADAGQPQQWWAAANGGQQFDAILLDAPCTASGIVRRHPDVRWLRRATDVEQLAAIQSQMLDALWPLLKPGGRLLYCTCSVFKAEGDAQVQAFLARNKQAQLGAAPGHLIPGNATQIAGLRDNAAGDHDGFFYALLHKKS